MFHVDCFVFAEFDPHIIEFDQIDNDEALALFDHDVDCFDNFVFLDCKIVIDKNQDIISLKIDYNKRFDAVKQI